VNRCRNWTSLSSPMIIILPCSHYFMSCFSVFNAVCRRVCLWRVYKRGTSVWDWRLPFSVLVHRRVFCLSDCTACLEKDATWLFSFLSLLSLRCCLSVSSVIDISPPLVFSLTRMPHSPQQTRVRASLWQSLLKLLARFRTTLHAKLFICNIVAQQYKTCWPRDFSVISACFSNGIIVRPNNRMKVQQCMIVCL